MCIRDRRGRHGEEFAGRIHVQFVHARHGFEILLGDLADENILDVDLRVLHQREQQIQRPIELLERNHVHAYSTPRAATIAYATCPTPESTPESAQFKNQGKISVTISKIKMPWPAMAARGEANSGRLSTRSLSTW